MNNTGGVMCLYDVYMICIWLFCVFICCIQDVYQVLKWCVYDVYVICVLFVCYMKRYDGSMISIGLLEYCYMLFVIWFVYDVYINCSCVSMMFVWPFDDCYMRLYDVYMRTINTCGKHF